MIPERTCKNGHPWIPENRGPIKGRACTYCRRCRRAAKKRWEHGDAREGYLEYMRWAYKRSKYGITKRDWQNMLLSQLGRCGICDENMTNPNIDHDHSTGDIRGMLCRNCNVGLGWIEKIGSKARAYLDK